MNSLVAVQIDFLVFDTPPEPFDEDIVQGPAAAVHADGHLMIFENPGEHIARELRALITIKDFRFRPKKSPIEGADAEILPDIITLIQPDIGKITFVNDEVTRYLGYSRDEAETMTVETLIHPADLASLKQAFMKLIEANNDAASISKYRVRHKNGEWRWIEHRAIIYSRKADSKPDLILCAANDITDSIETLQSLAINESKYRDLVENSKLLIGSHDTDCWTD